MLPALVGNYLTAASRPPFLPLAAAAAAAAGPLSPRAHSRGYIGAVPRFVSRRRAGPREAVRAVAAEEKDDEGEEEVLDEGFPSWERGSGVEDYDHDPEIGDIMGDYFDDPKKAQTRMEDRIRKKRHKIVQSKTGSSNPMKVVFNKFDFSNSYIWFEFYNTLLPKDATLLSDSLRSWYIVGHLGGCNSMNMQLSQLPLDCKRPSYDGLEGANLTPTSFHNIGDLEIQDNIARVWVDIGVHDPLLLDILLNALTTISSDHVGIKQIQFGGSEFENWDENLKTEEAGYSVRKI